MPRSIVSTTSAWCSASRAAHEIASDGVSSASGSRWRGRSVPAPAAGSRSQRSTRSAPTRPVKPMKSTASATLKREVEARPPAGARSGRAAAAARAPAAATAMKSSAPTHLKMQVAERQPPHLRRRVARSASIASTPLPRLAPSTRPSATGSGIIACAASVAVSSTIARLEYDSTVRTRADDDVEQHLVRQRDAAARAPPATR